MSSSSTPHSAPEIWNVPVDESGNVLKMVPKADYDRLQEQLEALREAQDLELDELRMQVVGAENDLRQAEAVVEAAREYVGEEPIQLWLNRGDRMVGALADPKWKRLVIALADSYPATESDA